MHPTTSLAPSIQRVLFRSALAAAKSKRQQGATPAATLALLAQARRYLHLT